MKDYKTGIYCFSAKHTTLRSKSKDWLAQNQDITNLGGPKCLPADCELVL